MLRGSDKRHLLRVLDEQEYVHILGASPVSRGKAQEMLQHGTVHGRALTQKQRGLFGVIASGHRPRGY